MGKAIDFAKKLFYHQMNMLISFHQQQLNFALQVQNEINHAFNKVAPSPIVDIVENIGDVKIDLLEAEQKRIETKFSARYNIDYIEEKSSRFVNDVLIDGYYQSRKLHAEGLTWALDVFGMKDMGIVRGFANFNEGAHSIWESAADGNWEAIKALGTMFVSVVILVYGLFFADVGSIFSAISAIAGVISSAQGVYGIFDSIAAYGAQLLNQAISSGSIFSNGIAFANYNYAQIMRYVVINMAMMAQQASNNIRTAFRNDMVTGSINDWMAGGGLYDSTRAGDVMFSPLLDMNTTRFLGVSSRSNYDMYLWLNGGKNDMISTTYKNLAGSYLFAIDPVSQRI